MKGTGAEFCYLDHPRRSSLGLISLEINGVGGTETILQ